MKILRFSILFGLGLALGGLLLPMQFQPVQAQEVPDSDNGAGAFDPGEIVPGIVTEGTDYLPIYVPTATNIIQQLNAGTYEPAIALGISSQLQQSIANVFVLNEADSVYVASAQDVIIALVEDGISQTQAEALVSSIAEIFDAVIEGSESAFGEGGNLTSSKGQSILVACAKNCDIAQAEGDIESPQEVNEANEQEIRIRVAEASTLLAAVNTFNEIVNELPPEQVLNPPDSVLFIRSILYDLVEATWVDGEPPSETEDMMK
jgi:hypothetical protein